MRRAIVVAATGLTALALTACGSARERVDTVDTGLAQASVASAPSAPSSLPSGASGTSAIGITRPPSIHVVTGSTDVDLQPWTFCFSNGCADGMPPDPLPAVGVGEAIEVDFPLDGWTFTADFQRANDPCARHQIVDVEPTGPHTFRLRPAGLAGTYAVTLFGRGDGDVSASFEWTTTGDGPLAVPEARLSILAEHDGKVDSYGVELDISNLAISPTTAAATITVNAANGRSLAFDAVPRPFGPRCPVVEGSVSWAGPNEQGVSAAALGSGPFTYDVTVTLDGVEHHAIATWPADQIVGGEPAVSLSFAPALPALGR